MTVNNSAYHISFNNFEKNLFALMEEIINEMRTTMRNHDCNLIFNTLTGECIPLEDFDRMAGILSGLPMMDEMYQEQNVKKIVNNFTIFF